LRLSVANELRGCGFSVTRSRRQEHEKHFPVCHFPFAPICFVSVRVISRIVLHRSAKQAILEITTKLDQKNDQ
jgi:hypothetical protein